MLLNRRRASGGPFGGGLPLGRFDTVSFIKSSNATIKSSNATLRGMPIPWLRGEAFASAECHDLIVQPFKIVRHLE